jgi:hypothetical protein
LITFWRAWRTIGAWWPRGTIAFGRPVASVRPIATGWSFNAIRTIRKAAKPTAEAAAESAAKTWRTAALPAADARAVARSISATWATSFDKLRQLGELAPTQHVVPVGIEPHEECLHVALGWSAGRTNRAARAIGPRRTSSPAIRLDAKPALDANRCSPAFSLSSAAASPFWCSIACWATSFFRTAVALGARFRVGVDSGFRAPLIFRTTPSTFVRRCLSISLAPTALSFPAAALHLSFAILGALFSQFARSFAHALVQLLPDRVDFSFVQTAIIIFIKLA